MQGSDLTGKRRAIEEAAARFAVDLACDPDGQVRVDAMRWAGQSPMHAVAMAKAEAAWASSGRLRALSTSPAQTEPTSIDGRAAGYLNRRVALGSLIAASVVGGLSTVALRWSGADRYSSGIGERRTVHLADGSRVQLNTGTSIKVALEPDRRHIHLVGGEAMFDVAHDPSRPFVVVAGATEMQALGTAFNVRLRQELVELTVSHGLVGVDEPGFSQRHVPAGSGAAIRDGAIAVMALTPDALAQRTAWRGGVIELNGETLSQAVDEFNRYRAKPLVIGDPKLASIVVGGRFSTADSLKFVEALQQSFAIRAVTADDQSVLLVASD